MVHPSRAPEFTPGFLSVVCVTRSLVLCVYFVDRCLSFIFLAIALSVLLQFTDSDYPFDIFKLFHIILHLNL